MTSADIQSLSLHRFLNQRYLAILIGLVVIFVLLVLFIRHGAMDDTTDYYMHYEASVLSEYYQVTDDIVEFDQGVKEYYWGLEQLPQTYRLLLEQHKDEQLSLNETLAFKSGDKFIYILPYFNQQKSAVFFVIHLFDLQSEALLYQSWQNIFILCVFILLALVIYYSLRTNNKITQQLLVFHQWVTSVVSMKLADIDQQGIPDTLSFDELTSSAQSLQTSLRVQHQLQQQQQMLVDREKHFLSSLSHELRTPIAIMSAALTLLNKSDAITAQDRKRIAKLTAANQSMKQLTQVLLLLWRNEQVTDPVTGQVKSPPQLENKVFLLDELVERLIILCQQQFQHQSIHFRIEKKDNIKIFAPYELMEIMLHNLLRNACQYTANNTVSIMLSERSLVVENELLVPHDSFDAKNSYDTISNSIRNNEQSINYGYGVGLFLVEKIAAQLACQIDIQASEQGFRVEVFFNKLYVEALQSH